MRKILFNNPIYLKASIENTKKFIYQKKSLYGSGNNLKTIKIILKKNLKFKNILLTNSCTSALEISALAIKHYSNLKNEIIIPSYSYITSGSSFVRAGFKLRYCDIEKDNLMPSFNSIKKLCNKKTAAIVITHYQGFSVNYLNKLKLFCKKNNIYLVEDAAQAFGSYFKNIPLGNFGDFACFSFHETKNIHCGAGGMLVVNNKKMITLSKYIFDKGSDREDVINKKSKYYSWVTIGSSFLMTELSASFLLPQIIHYEKIVRVRKKIYLEYLRRLTKLNNNNFQIINNKSNFKYNYHALVIVLKRNIRNKFLLFLKKFNIHAFIGYMPLHKSKRGKLFLLKSSQLKNTNLFSNKIIRLPLNNYMNKNDLKVINDKIKIFFNR